LARKIDKAKEELQTAMRHIFSYVAEDVEDYKELTSGALQKVNIVPLACVSATLGLSDMKTKIQNAHSKQLDIQRQAMALSFYDTLKAIQGWSKQVVKHFRLLIKLV
jgi:hypothetical protein